MKCAFGSYRRSQSSSCLAQVAELLTDAGVPGVTVDTLRKAGNREADPRGTVEVFLEEDLHLAQRLTGYAELGAPFALLRCGAEVPVLKRALEVSIRGHATPGEAA